MCIFSRQASRSLITTLWLGILANSSAATLVNTFAPEILGPAQVGAIYPEPGGKVYLRGSFTKVDGLRNVGSFIRLNADGSLDQSFTLGKTVSGVSKILPLSDGRICLLGSFTEINGVPRPKIALLTSDGFLDLTFAPPAGALPGTPTSAALDAQNRVLVSMTSSSVSFTNECVTRLRADGSPDESFQKPTFYSLYYQGLIGANVVFALPSGKILLGGNFESWNGNPAPRGRGFASPYLTVLNEDGTRDTTFVPTLPIVSTNQSLTGVLSGVIWPDGSIALGGSLQTSSSRTAAVKLKSDLTLDPTFHVESNTPTFNIPVARRIAGDSKGGLAMIGIFGAVNQLTTDSGLMVDAKGNPYAASADLHRYFSDEVATGPNDQIFFGGSVGPYYGNKNTQRGLIAYTAPGQPSTTFRPQLLAPGLVDIVVPRPEGRGVIVSGSTTKEVMDTPFEGPTALRPDGTLDPAFRCTTVPSNGVSLMLPLPGGRYLLVGAFTSVNGVNAAGLAVIDDHGTLLKKLDDSFTPDGPVLTANLLPTGKVAITGAFSKFGSFATARMAILDPNAPENLLDTSFSCATVLSGSIAEAAGLSDGSVVVGGSFQNGIDPEKRALEKFSSTGQRDPTFNPLAELSSAQILAIASDSENRVVISGYFSRNSVETRGLLRISAEGSLDAQFTNPTLSYTPERILIDHSSRIYAKNSSGIARFGADGTLDSSFTFPYSTGGPGSDFAFAPSNRIYLCGAFTISNTSYVGVRAFQLDGALPPFLTFAPDEITALEGESITISPLTPGTEETYAWTKDGNSLPNQDHSTLTLNPVGLSDAGDYSVTATNAAGSTTATLHLAVSPAPVEPVRPNSPPDLPAAFPQKPKVTMGAKKLLVQGSVSDGNGVARVAVYYRGKRIALSKSSKWKVRLAPTMPKRVSLLVVVTDVNGHQTVHRYTVRNPAET